MRNWGLIRQITMEVVEKEDDGPVPVAVWLGMGGEARRLIRQGEVAEEIGLIADKNPGSGSKMYVATEEGRRMYTLWRDEEQWRKTQRALGDRLKDYDLEGLKKRIIRRTEKAQTGGSTAPFGGEEGQERKALLNDILEKVDYKVSTEESPATAKLHRQLRWLENEEYIYKGSSWRLDEEVWHISRKGQETLRGEERTKVRPTNLRELKEAITDLEWFTEEEIEEICRLTRGRNDRDTEDPIGSEIRTVMNKTLERVGTGLDMIQKMQKACDAMVRTVEWVKQILNFAG